MNSMRWLIIGMNTPKCDRRRYGVDDNPTKQPDNSIKLPDNQDSKKKY